MSELLKELVEVSTHWDVKFWDGVRAYVETGNPKLLQKNSQRSGLSCAWGVIAALQKEEDFNDAVRRIWEVYHHYGDLSGLIVCAANWSRHGSSKERFDQMLEELRKLVSEEEIATEIAARCGAVLRNEPTLFGRYLLSVKDDILVRCFEYEGASRLHQLVELLCRESARRATKIFTRLLKNKNASRRTAAEWAHFVNAVGKDAAPVAAKAVDQFKAPFDQFLILGSVAHHDSKFHDETVERALSFLADCGTDSDYRRWERAGTAARWLAVNALEETLGQLENFLAGSIKTRKVAPSLPSGLKIDVIDAAVEKHQPKAVPLLRAVFATDQAPVQLHALRAWVKIQPDAKEKQSANYAVLLQGSDNATVAQAVRFAGEWDCELVEEHLWPMFAHKSRGVRESTASMLADFGDTRLKKVKELWAAKKADARIATVSWLNYIGTAKAIAALQKHLGEEENDNVRDAILLALESCGSPYEPSAQELKKRIAITLGKTQGSPVKWLKPKELPALKLANGKKLSEEQLLYLLHRQSRVKEMRGDFEARNLMGKIDRASSGDLALAVFQAFVASGAAADGKWAIAFAALLGDDRLVALLVHQIKEWADASRGKLGEYAVQALALMGTDRALLAVDTMAIRYRTKFKNIGKAATEAFAAAAEARGTTVEELGDNVVPWLGFEPGKARVIDCGKRQVEFRIGSDFDFAFSDPETGKRVAKLPGTASKETKAEFKELRAMLKEAVKSQLLRMEILMVRQFRWPRERWEQLYLTHPLLIPFSQRLIWGQFDGKGKLVATFRALEDLSLSDAEDNTVKLKGKGDIGVVHPLELSAAQRNAWCAHQSDYGVRPPFAQLARSIVKVDEEDSKTTNSYDFDGTNLNAMTFRGRAEKLGWMRGSVCDAGCISYYRKVFANAGVDVFLGLDGMYVGVDMYEEVKLQEVFFAKTGSVKIGSYEYDEPGTGDPRLVAFGDVPPIAFSEAMSDLITISGKDPKDPQTENPD